MSDREERARVKLELIYQNLDQEGKNNFASNLFSGTDESNRRSTRRLIAGSRNISSDKIEFINRSYGQRKKRKVFNAESFEKADVSDYFKGFIQRGQRAWNGTTPPFAFLNKYRIRAEVSLIQFQEGVWTTITKSIFPQGSGTTFRELATLLQEELENIFNRFYDAEVNTTSVFRTWGIAMTNDGESEMVNAFNKSPNSSAQGMKKNKVYPIGESLFVEIYSIGNETSPRAGGMTFKEVRN